MSKKTEKRQGVFDLFFERKSALFSDLNRRVKKGRFSGKFSGNISGFKKDVLFELSKEPNIYRLTL